MGSWQMLITRKTMVSWQAFPSLVSLAPKTPFPFPFKRLPRRLFKPKNVLSALVFRPALQAEIMLSLLRLERKHTNPSNPFRIFLFLSYSFGIETINTLIHSRSSPANHTRFQAKMGKVYTRFQTKTAQKPNPMAVHTYKAYIREYPPPPGRADQRLTRS